MALITEARRSELRFAKRIDAEHYSPRFTRTLEQLRRHTPIRLRTTLREPVKTGHTPSTKVSAYYGGEINFIKTDNLREDRVETLDVQTLSERGNAEISNSELQVDDVILTIIGATEDIVGRAARISREILRANINQNIALIRSNIPSGYLTTFLNSYHGREQLIWLSRQTGQVNLNCREVEEFMIPTFSNEFVNAIHELNSARQHLLEAARASYQKATVLLFKELKLTGWFVPAQSTYVRRQSEVVRLRRIDAEHFHPKYDALLKILNKEARELKYIKDIRTFNARGKQPEYLEDGALRQINSKHILEQNLDYERFEHTDMDNWDKQREARVFKNDILTYSTGANVGRTNIYLDDERALASNHVNILRVQNADPIYVSFVMNSVIGRLQTRKWISGTAQAELYPSDIDRFVIPFVRKDAQEEISSMIVDAHRTRNEAAFLFSKAKMSVESAIEEGDGTAMRLLREV